MRISYIHPYTLVGADPVLGRYFRIGPEAGQYQPVTACLQGFNPVERKNCNDIEDN